MSSGLCRASMLVAGLSAMLASRASAQTRVATATVGVSVRVLPRVSFSDSGARPVIETARLRGAGGDVVQVHFAPGGRPVVVRAVRAVRADSARRTVSGLYRGRATLVLAPSAY